MAFRQESVQVIKNDFGSKNDILLYSLKTRDSKLN